MVNLTPDQLQAELLQLPAPVRARLAQALLESLEEPDAELDLAWSTEVQRRYAELKSGAVEAVPAEVAFARARARLNESR